MIVFNKDLPPRQESSFRPFNVKNDGPTSKQRPPGVSQWGEEDEAAMFGAYTKNEPQTKISAIC